MYELSAAREIRMKPGKGGVSNTNGGESMEEDSMRDGVKGCTEIEEDEDGE